MVAQPDETFLRQAVAEAELGFREGGIPIGSVLVRNGRVIGTGRNRRMQHGSPTRHAEIDCLENAGRQRTYRDTILYSTLMPCYLCGGAVVQFGIPRVVVGDASLFAGSTNFLRDQGVILEIANDPTSRDLLKAFIRVHPDVWNEDIGV